MRKMTTADIDLQDRKRRWDGFYKLDQLYLRHRRYDGTWSEVLDREVLERNHVVGILPYDPVKDRLVLIEQFRPAAISTQQIFPEMPIWMVEIPAGITKPDEAPEEVAHRELEEETGLTLKRLVPITRYFTSQGCTNETVMLYYAEIDAPEEESLHGIDEESEDIRRFTVTLKQAQEMMASGEICNASALIALQWLMLNKERLTELS